MLHRAGASSTTSTRVQLGRACQIWSGYRYWISIWDIDSYGIWDIDIDIDMGYGLSTWDMGYRHGHSPYRYGHPGYRYGIWANDMGDDRIDMVILDIDMGYLVTLVPA